MRLYNRVFLCVFYDHPIERAFLDGHALGLRWFGGRSQVWLLWTGRRFARHLGRRLLGITLWQGEPHR